MDNVLGLIFNANSLQTLVILVAVISGYVFLNSKIDKRFMEQDKRIDAKFAAQDEKIAALDVKFDEKIAALDTKFDAKFVEFEKKIYEKIDTKFDDFYQKLKNNDFAHLQNAISALTFLIKRNKIIDAMDEQYVKEQFA